MNEGINWTPIKFFNNKYAYSTYEHTYIYICREHAFLPPHLSTFKILNSRHFLIQLETFLLGLCVILLNLVDHLAFWLSWTMCARLCTEKETV